MSKHTPGPWSHDEKFPCCVWANDVWVASTNVETIPSLEERAANARLIAAAPEMLDALKLVRTRLAHRGKCVTPNPTEEWPTRGSCNFDNCDCEVSIVEAAIRKAEEGQ